jgi:hypothetical protein
MPCQPFRPNLMPLLMDQTQSKFDIGRSKEKEWEKPGLVILAVVIAAIVAFWITWRFLADSN